MAHLLDEEYLDSINEDNSENSGSDQKPVMLEGQDL